MKGFIAFCLLSLTAVTIAQQWDYECSFEGERHPHEISCIRYYECRSNGQPGGFFTYLFKCTEGFFYNGPLNSCIRGTCPVIPDPTTPEPELTTTREPELPTTQEPEPSTQKPELTTLEPEVTTEAEVTDAPPTTPSPPVTRPPFVCKENGYFVDTEDCNIFHHCTNCENICQDNKLQCPVNHYFCEEFSACASSSFCECAADEKIPAIFKYKF